MVPKDDAPARTIQRFFRQNQHRLHSWALLRDHRNELDRLRHEFKPPDVLDFDPASGKLLYTARNRPIHTFEQRLLNLLEKLDEVESHDDIKIRRARKKLANDIENELRRLDEMLIRKRDQSDMGEMEGDVDPESGRVAVSAGRETPVDREGRLPRSAVRGKGRRRRQAGRRAGKSAIRGGATGAG